MSDQPFRVGEWQVEPMLDQVMRGSEVHRLEPRTMRVLVRLAQTPGKVVSSEELLDSAWSGVIVSPASVYQAISQLRKLLGDTDETPRYIATVPRRGYRLVAAVVRDAHGPLASSPESPSKRSRIHWSWFAAAGGLAVLLAGFLLWTRATPIPATSTVPRASTDTNPLAAKTLALLPLRVPPGGADETLRSAVTFLLRHRLAAIAALPLVGGDSTHRYQTADFDARDLGGKLHARYLLDGEVSSTADRLQIKVNLHDTTRGQVLWSMQLDRPASEVTAMREEITQRIVDTLHIDGATRSAAGRAPVRLDAYRLFAEAQVGMASDATVDQIAQGSALFQRSTELDPRFARGYLGVAQTLIYRSNLTPNAAADISTTDAKNAQRAVERALELDPALGEGWITRARLTPDRETAEQWFRKGLDLAPNDTIGAMFFAWFLSAQGRGGEAIDVLDRASLLDPYTPVIPWLKAGMLLDAHGDVDGALRLYQESLAINPGFSPAKSALLTVRFFHQGEFAAAIRDEEKDHDPRGHRVSLATAYLEVDDPVAANNVWLTPPDVPTFKLMVLSLYAGDTHAAVKVAETTLAGTRRGLYGFAARTLRDEAIATGDYRWALERVEPMYLRQQETWTEQNADRSLAIIYAHLLILSGRRQEGEDLARKLLEASKANENGRPLHWFSRERSVIYAMLGDDDTALAELAWSQKLNMWVDWWYTADHDPTFAHLRNDPRFRALADAAKRQRQAQRLLVDEMRRKGEIPLRGHDQGR